MEVKSSLFSLSLFFFFQKVFTNFAKGQRATEQQLGVLGVTSMHGAVEAILKRGDYQVFLKLIRFSSSSFFFFILSLRADDNSRARRAAGSAPPRRHSSHLPAVSRHPLFFLLSFIKKTSHGHESPKFTMHDASLSPGSYVEPKTGRALPATRVELALDQIKVYLKGPLFSLSLSLFLNLPVETSCGSVGQDRL